MNKKIVSQSEISTWQRCKRKWYLSYFRRLRAIQLAPSPLTQGTYFHAALEHMEANWRAVLAEMVEADYERVDPLQHAEVTKQHELAVIMVEGLIPWAEEEGLNAGLTVISREREVAADMGDWILRGKLDEELERADGAYGFRDWKSANDFRLFKLAAINRQFPTYTVLTRKSGRMARFGQWVVARKVKRTARAKPPFYAKHDRTFNTAQVDAMERQMDGEVKRMMHWTEVHLTDKYHLDTVFPPNPSYDCGTCPFVQVCENMNDGSDWERQLDDWFTVGDPDERYEKSIEELLGIED